MLRDLALHTRQLKSWWYAAALACSLTDLKTADFHQTSARNYPFQYNFNYTPPNDGTPHSFAGCAAAAPYGFTATFESGFACTPLDPTAVNANGLGLRGIQFNYQTPYTMSGNFTLQYQLTPTLTVQAGYVTSLARHLEVFPNSNNPTQVLPTGTPLTNGSGANGTSACPPPLVYPAAGCGFPASQGGLPFADFGQGSSYAITSGNSFYHGLQTKVEKRFARRIELPGHLHVVKDAYRCCGPF